VQPEGRPDSGSCGIVFARWKPIPDRPRTLSSTPLPETRSTQAIPGPFIAIAALLIIVSAGFAHFDPPFNTRSVRRGTPDPVHAGDTINVNLNAPTSLHPTDSGDEYHSTSVAVTRCHHADSGEPRRHARQPRAAVSKGHGLSPIQL